MAKDWPKLSKPPVDVALFQLKYELGESELKDFLQVEDKIKETLPSRADNITANIDLPSSPIPLGLSKITGTSNAKLSSYTFFSRDQKSKLTITENSITYVDESAYGGWDNFSIEIFKYLNILAPVLGKHIISRTSIRFINQFAFNEFDNPGDYFKSMISTTEDESIPFPVQRYGFRIMLDIKENVYSIVNQNVDKASDKYIYIFDIDVLNQNNILFDMESIKDILSDLREAKNRIFFGNVTDKLIELCR